jgi:hypothetical protein
MGQAGARSRVEALLQHRSMTVEDVPHIGNARSAGASTNVVQQAQNVRSFRLVAAD